MNTPLQNQISDRSLKAKKHHRYRLGKSFALFFVSAGIFVVFCIIRPCPRLVQSWNAAMHNDSLRMHSIATKLLYHSRMLCRYWGLYYDAFAKVMSEKNMNVNDALALRATLLKEYFYKGQTIADEDIAHLVPQHAPKAEFETIDKYMYMLLGYLDFYRMDYHNAVKVYWEILQRYETDDVIRHNYEMSLFFLNYTEINKKESHFSTAVETEKKNIILPIPSLMKVYTGSEYYMREKEKSDSTLPAY